jgi:hypothetical protein
MILSRDGKQEFHVCKNFLTYFNYVFLSQNKWAFMQKEDAGSGSRNNTEPFKGLYSYHSTITMTVKMRFETNFDNFQSPVVADLLQFPTLPTYCNYNVAEAFTAYGFETLSRLIKEKNLDGNGTVAMLEHGVLGYNIREISDLHPGIPTAANTNRLIIAGQFLPNGIGHVAPVVGVGTNMKLYVSNIGAIARDGVVDIGYAFAATKKDIKLFVVERS